MISLNIIIFPFVLLCRWFVPSFGENVPVVALPFGKVLGIQRDGFYEFHNIPFSEPPIGKHRFEPPIPYKQNWSKELDGTQPMIRCVSFERYTPNNGVEDCLYLHVLTPDISCNKLYPVRIQIHGGAFTGGSPDTVDTSILIKHGIVIVIMAYRLGPLGFLSTGDKIISGNNGLKDQRLAIMWVKSHIRNFCGDDNNILLAGASAGGASSHMHLMQKATENYVNAVATHNAAASNPWALEPDPQYVSMSFAEKLNCPKDSETMKTCMQEKTIDELREATFALQFYKNNPFTVFAPVIESWDTSDPFVMQHPEEIARNGQCANITWLVGYTEREGSYNAATFLVVSQPNGTVDIDVLNKRWDELAPILLFFNRSMNDEERKQYSRSLRERYMGGNEFSEVNYRLFENIYSDVLFNNDIKKSIQLQRKYCPGRIYAYYYRYPHDFGIGNVLSKRNDISFGPDHTADTIFIIPKSVLKPTVFIDRDVKFSKKLLDMHLNWAQNGVLRFGEKDLPRSTFTNDGLMIFNENCYSTDGCLESSKSGCTCLAYD